MNDQKNLVTERLILRPFSLSDAGMVQELAGDVKVSGSALNIPYPYEDGMAEEWIGTHEEAFQEGNGVTYAIVNKETGEVIGAIGLMVELEHRKAELGYWIGVPFWGNGYCTEAALSIIDYGLKELDLNKIYARALASNTGSWTVMEKAGMSYEGTLRQDAIRDGIAYDLKSYAILREDFK